MAFAGMAYSSPPSTRNDHKSKGSSIENSDQKATRQQDKASCADCVNIATDEVLSVAKSAGVACQQAAFCLFATCVSVFGPSLTHREPEHLHGHVQSAPSSASGVLEGLYAPPMPLTMAEHPYTALERFASNRSSSCVKQLAVTVWTGGFIQRPALAMQVWVGWRLVAAIFHRRVDILIFQQQHVLNTLQHMVNMMSMEACARQEASRQAARHGDMQLVSVVYRTWLPPPDCCMLTWQQMTTAMSWQQILQVMDIIAAPLSADDRDLGLQPTTASLGLEWVAWQNRLSQSRLHVAHDDGTASPYVHAQALLAKHLAQLRGRRQRRVHLRSLAAIAVSHVVMSSTGLAQRKRLHGHVNRKPLTPVMSLSHSHTNRQQLIAGQPLQHVVSNTGHSVLLATASQSSNRPSSQSLSADPCCPGQQGSVNVAQVLPTGLSNSSSSQSPSAAPSPGQQGPLRAAQKSAGLHKVSVISYHSSSHGVSQQAMVGQPSIDNTLSDMPALQSMKLASNATSEGQASGLQQSHVCARRSRFDGISDRQAPETAKHRLSRCTHAADLPMTADKLSSSASPARQWLRSVSLKGETLKAEAVREAGRVIRRVSAGDLAVKASAMTVEAKKKSTEWLRARKHSWSIPAQSLQNAGGAETVEVISEEECRTVFKPLPMLTGRDGHHYSPVQAASHVLGLDKDTVDTAVTSIRTATSAVADATRTAMLNLATALEGVRKGAQRDSDGVSEVAYMPVATGVDAEAYTPMQAIGHVIGVRRETTDALINNIQTTVSKLQGSTSLEPEAWPLQPG